jgi:hypothetical protein
MSHDDHREMNGGPSPPAAGSAGSKTKNGTPAPVQVKELSDSFVRFALTKYNVRLDGTSDTLSIVDQYIRDARPEIAAKPESLALLEAAIGAYFGEVVRGVYEARWFAEGDMDGWRLDMVNVYLTFNPIGMAREALTLGDAEGWHAHLEVDEAEKEVIDQRLSALPQVSDDEFYSPSTRFDVVALVVETLRAHMVAGGLGDVRFGPEDYRRR